MAPTSDIRQTTFSVRGLCCATEEQLVRKKLRALAGIQELQFDVIMHTLKVRHTCNETDITASLTAIGLPASAVTKTEKPIEQKTPPRQLVSTALSGSLLLSGGLFAWLNLPEILPTIFFSLSIVAGGWQFAVKGFRAVKNLSLDMNFLMSVAALGAVAIGEYAEGAAVVFLFALSLLLESLSIDRSRRAIQSLMKLAPTTAAVFRENMEVIVPVEDVRLDETIIIRPGERIPLDGKVLSGQSTIDESTITGEAMPVPKKTHDSVFAGTFNQRGSLEARVTRLVGDSTLARIIHQVEEAQSKKAPSQAFVEQFARYYTPAVFLLAIAVAAVPPLIFQQEFASWFYRALVLLVIACPCALVISTPVAVVCAMTNAARNGILVKGGRYWEELARVQVIAFDKTGTLTEGKPTLTDVISLNSLSESEILQIATAVEVKSEHHLADAFLRKSAEQRISIDELQIENFESIPGKGVKAVVNGNPYIVGSHQFIEDLGVCSPEVEKRIEGLEAEGKTTVLLTDGKQVLGVLAVADTLRRESAQLIRSLQELGLQRIVMLTGDSRTATQMISNRLNISEQHTEMLPEDKLKAVETLKAQHGSIAMVGDGVNDAPALAAANVGIAMGGAGSDTSLETADVVLMSDDLSKIPHAISVGKKTLAIIQQNVFIALATKAVFLSLGVFGLTSLWLALLADDGATLVVILNAFRLLRKGADSQSE